MPPSLPSIVTPALLTSIRTHPLLPRHTWYYITSVTLSCLNRPDEIPTVFKHAVEDESREAEQLRIIRRMREGLVKSAAVVGLPKTINALFELKKATPPHLLDPPMELSPSGRPIDVYDTSPSLILHRGQTFFNKVYGKISKRVMGQMDRSGTEDLGLVARLMYGYLLSNVSVLNEVETSWVLAAGLIPQDVNPQLKGHLKGAVNNGATVEEVRAVRECVIRICEESGMKMLKEGEMGGWGWRGEVANL
ncbi:hypothetical protein EJ08DRAFT_702784 [Tothia fuscella]|uniref:Carboxymuconolactone decarboxylase-like domain-containing protein n=1 Tax=Tothia fuscella TaxID=1048955 RepID=A0A9P4NFK7_9PEZI|nr:hypothetical protein EJ08DRAFT_702784 [Tothia fuscella]